MAPVHAGLWLAFMEVTVNRMLWMSNFDFQHHGAGVFWAIGWSMVVLSVLNCTKYPASLLYLLMTLGPAILVLVIFDRPSGLLARPIITFGRVPLFFYLLHIPLIHGGAVLCDWLRFGWSPLAGYGPWEVQVGSIPPNYGLSLPMVYLLWIGVVLVLYPPCRWFAGVKSRRRDVWLSYL